jgi:hypothetical protein
MDYLAGTLVLVITFKIVVGVALSSAYIKRAALHFGRWALAALHRCVWTLEMP